MYGHLASNASFQGFTALQLPPGFGFFDLLENLALLAMDTRNLRLIDRPLAFSSLRLMH